MTLIGLSRHKRRILDFVGQIFKSLFGTATPDDIATLQRHMQTLNRNNAQIAATIVIQEKHFPSFISTVDARFNNIRIEKPSKHSGSNRYCGSNRHLHSSVDSVEHVFVCWNNLL